MFSLDRFTDTNESHNLVVVGAHRKLRRLPTNLDTHSRNRVTVGIRCRILQELKQTTFDLVGHDVFPTACFIVGTRPIQTNDIDQESFSQAMLTNDLYSLLTTFFSQLQSTITQNVQKPVAFHASNGLRNGRT